MIYTLFYMIYFHTCTCFISLMYMYRHILFLSWFPNRSLLLRVLMVTQKKGKERKRDRKRAWADSPETSRRDLANFFGLGRLSRDPAPRSGQIPLKFLFKIPLRFLFKFPFKFPFKFHFQFPFKFHFMFPFRFHFKFPFKFPFKFLFKFLFKFPF